jgi:hypothetical protein
VDCGACTNESLSFKNKTPITVWDQENNRYFPYSTTQEVNRLVKMLHKHGFEVTWQVIPEGSNSLCMRNIDSPIVIERTTPDVILALCCPAGIFGLRKIIGSTIPIIQITKKSVFFLILSKKMRTKKGWYINTQK